MESYSCFGKDGHSFFGERTQIFKSEAERKDMDMEQERYVSVLTE